MTQIYSYTAKEINGQELKLEAFKDKVLLVVNTASACGFTPQYAGLEALYRQYQQQGLVVLGFPCNQFGNQEPADNASIATFCATNYGVSFPMFQKIDVNGQQAHPLFQYLKRSKTGLLGFSDIKWNFTKFLINRNGDVVKRYAPTSTPLSLSADIEKLL